ncbi:hypothetical protein F5Y16DRAFT_198762 [Xylariaceae sp. FL0255]|nr:hypothetical protein F5Y16DRAFT_198762 [Xylariaceae sp. FL0255]
MSHLRSEKEEQFRLLGEAAEADENLDLPARSPSAARRFKLSSVLLFASLTLNVILLGLLPILRRTEVNPPTKYAGLRRDREEPIFVKTKYDSENETLQDQLWHDISVDSAYVALDDEWATQRGLPIAQRFPWDHSKGLYLLHGFHNLHCLKTIYLSLAEYRRGDAQTRDWRHVSHCLDALRRQVICDADDTPRKTERRPEVVSGILQHRMCRRWEDLEDFAKQHTACYKRPEDPGLDTRPIIDRFKHCPPGSGYVITENYTSPDPWVEGFPDESIDLE